MVPACACGGGTKDDLTGEIVWDANCLCGGGEDELLGFELVRVGDVNFAPTVGVLIERLDQDFVAKGEVD